jgi:DNA-binding NarL/FixJ family response regulator
VVIVVSGHEDNRVISQALSYGAAGFIPKSHRKADLAAAIREVMDGAIYVPATINRSRRNRRRKTSQSLIRRLSTLTPQQMRVLNMLRQGLLNKQIAYELQVGETTVKAHVSEILRKAARLQPHASCDRGVAAGSGRLFKENDVV